MKALTAVLAGLIIGCLTSEPLQAQTPVVVPVSSYYSLPAPYGHHHPGWWGYRYHASTAAEGYMRGVAAMTRAQGEYNLMTSQANVYNQQAVSLGLDNHRKGVETYYAARKISREARAEERGPRPTQEELVRLAKEAAPDRLDNTQLHPATGQIAWPTALQADQYTAYRERIEQIFAEKGSDGQLNLRERESVAQAAGAMRILLKQQIQEMSPMEYTSARRFLDGLAYEAQLAAT